MFCGNGEGGVVPLPGGAKLNLCLQCQELIEDLHTHLDRVTLPQGSTLTAASFFAGYDRPTDPDFGLYLDPCWKPPWPHAYLNWPNFGVPRDPASAKGPLEGLLGRAREGELVEIGCLGGHGRTGAALGCLAVLCGAAGSAAVAWVRDSYCPLAIETAEQAAFVEHFS